MARGHPSPDGRPDLRQKRHGARIPTPCMRWAPEVADRGRTGLHARWSRPVTSRRTDAQVSSTPARTRRTTRDRHADSEPAPRGRVFVLDTSVLLSDPAAFRRFADHEVVIPLVVISELEGKRHHPELGWFARQSLRILDELRIKYGRLGPPGVLHGRGGHARG